MWGYHSAVRGLGHFPATPASGRPCDHSLWLEAPVDPPWPGLSFAGHVVTPLCGVRWASSVGQLADMLGKPVGKARASYPSQSAKHKFNCFCLVRNPSNLRRPLQRYVCSHWRSVLVRRSHRSRISFHRYSSAVRRRADTATLDWNPTKTGKLAAKVSYRNNRSCSQKVRSGFCFKGRLGLTLTLILGFRAGAVTSRASLSASG